MGPYYNSTFRLSRATHTLSLHRPGLTSAYGLRRAKVAAGRLSLFLFAFDVNKPHRVIPKRGRVAARVWEALVIAKIVNLYRLYMVDCSICKFYTVIKLSTNYICIVVNSDSIW